MEKWPVITGHRLLFAALTYTSSKRLKIWFKNSYFNFIIELLTYLVRQIKTSVN